jgi:hypothetical protein
VAELVISNLSVVGSSGSYALDTLRASVQYYTDRAFTVNTPVPPDLDGQVMIKTPNEDKANDMGTVFTLEVNMAVTVYIAVDARGAADANWMDAYTAAGMTLQTSDVTLNVMERVAGPGEISFGGNHDAGNTGAGSNYIVVIVPYAGGQVVHQADVGPGGHEILSVYPNPFNPVVKIAGSGQRIADSNIGIAIYDIKGKMVNKLSATRYQLSAGIAWNASAHPSGTYIVRLTSGPRTFQKKIILLK